MEDPEAVTEVIRPSKVIEEAKPVVVMVYGKPDNDYEITSVQKN